MKPFALLVVGLLSVSEGAAQLKSQSSQQIVVPPGAEVACPFDSSKAQLPVICGRLKVPENYGDAQGRSIEIAFMVVKARQNIDPLNPVIYISGGPGAPSLVYIEMLVATPEIHDVVVDRDWVFFDQRGEGRSTPALYCPPGEKDRFAQISACRDNLTKQGIDLSQYNSARSASDIEALRKALGVKQWNIWGTSYGTKVAFAVARYYPSSVRSIVHDAAGLPEDQEMVDDFRGTEVALDRLFSKCATDAACSMKFPGLRSRFLAALSQLRQQPISLGDARFNDGRVMRFVRNNLFGGGSPAIFEQRVQNMLIYMDAAARADGALMLKIEMGMPKEVDPFDQNPVPVQGYFHLGQHLSVDCNEEKPFESLDEYKGAAAKSEIVRSLFGDQGGQGVLKECSLWPSGRADPIENTHVYYDGPQLVFTGELDASLSGLAGFKIAMLYANATNVMFRNGTHAQVHLADYPPKSKDDYRMCALGLARQFFHDPQRNLDAACAETRKLHLVQ